MIELAPVTGGGRLEVRSFGIADLLAVEAAEMLEEATRLNRPLPLLFMPSGTGVAVGSSVGTLRKLPLAGGGAPPADRELIDDNGVDLELLADAGTDHELL